MYLLYKYTVSNYGGIMLSFFVYVLVRGYSDMFVQFYMYYVE